MNAELRSPVVLCVFSFPFLLPQSAYEKNMMEAILTREKVLYQHLLLIPSL
jgi:hypothetical protein